MKIALLSHEYPPFLGGAGSVAFDYFTELDRLKYDIHLYSHGNIQSNQQENIHAVSSVIRQHSLLNYIKYAFSICGDLKKYDIIIVNDIFFSTFACLFFDKEIISKTIFFCHGGEVDAFDNKINLFRKSLKLGGKYKAILEDSKGVVFVSEFYKNKFMQKIDINLQGNSCVIHNGIVNKTVFRQMKGIDQKIVILSASRIIKEKGYLTLLDKLEPLLASSNRFVWRIAGSGPFLSELSSIIDERNLAHKIELLGYVPKHEMDALYINSDLFILLSEFDEAHPLCYLEAASFGVPSIAWNKGGCPESIMDGVSGCLIDNICDLEGAIEKCLSLSVIGIKRFALEHSINKSINKLMAIINGC